MSVNLPKFTQLVQLMNNRKRLGSEVLNEVAAGTARNDQAMLRVGYITIPSVLTTSQLAFPGFAEALDVDSG